MSGGVMGAVEDTRKILQDFLAPELREIKVRLDVLEKRVDGVDRKVDKVDEKIDAVGSALNKKIDDVASALNNKIDDVGGGLDKKIDDVNDSLSGEIIRLTEKVEHLDRRSEQRHEVVMMALGRLVDYTEVRERLARLEGQQHPQ